MENVGTVKGDKLVLRGLKFHGYHGVKPKERKLGQKSSVDVDAWLDLQPAGKSDCLSDTVSYTDIYRNSDTNVSNKLIFGEDKDLLSHPNLNFTSFVVGKKNLVDTFYYLQIKAIVVGGEVLNIPEETWNLSPEGAGGTIIDSGTTLSYFTEPADEIIKEAFVKKVKGYPLLEDFPILSPCYNVSRVEKIELPEFKIHFADGAVWNFLVENYFILLEPEGIVCLAIMGTSRSSLSIIGNYQQQNFHIWYDIKKSRLGYAPMKFADV